MIEIIPSGFSTPKIFPVLNTLLRYELELVRFPLLHVIWSSIEIYSIYITINRVLDLKVSLSETYNKVDLLWFSYLDRGIRDSSNSQPTATQVTYDVVSSQTSSVSYGLYLL